MIASVRGLMVLGVIAVLLAVAVFVGAPAAAIIDRTLVPGFSSESALSITFSYTGKPDVVVTRVKNSWVTRGASEDFERERSTVEAVLAALRGATWHRRADAAVGNPTRGGIRVAAPAGPAKLLIGRDVPGSAQTWIVAGDHALLVDSWVAHALLPDPLELQVRQPLAGAPVAARLAGPGVRVDGRFQAEPVKRWIAEPVFNDLVSALVDLTIVSLDGAHPAARARSVSVDDIEVTEAGTCDGDRIRVETSAYGDGCVERAAWQRVLAAFVPLARLTDPALVDTRLVPFTPTSVKFMLDIANPADNTELGLEGRTQIGTEDADLDRVRELLAALATEGTMVPLPTRPPRVYLDVRGRENLWTRLSIFDGVVARADEPFALRPSPEAFAVITRPHTTLRDPVLWREDATTLSALTLDGVTYQRGAVIGEWSRTSAGKADAALVDSLASTLANVRGAASPFPAKVAHRISVTFTPPAGPPTTHTLALAAPTAEGCTARVDDKPVRLDLPLCMAAVALAATH